jgi:hypothetical protein
MRMENINNQTHKEFFCKNINSNCEIVEKFTDK